MGHSHSPPLPDASVPSESLPGQAQARDAHALDTEVLVEVDGGLDALEGRDRIPVAEGITLGGWIGGLWEGQKAKDFTHQPKSSYVVRLGEREELDTAIHPPRKG